MSLTTTGDWRPSGELPASMTQHTLRRRLQFDEGWQHISQRTFGLSTLTQGLPGARTACSCFSVGSSAWPS
jgi:hypothetical protein